MLTSTRSAPTASSPRNPAKRAVSKVALPTASASATSCTVAMTLTEAPFVNRRSRGSARDATPASRHHRPLPGLDALHPGHSRLELDAELGSSRKRSSRSTTPDDVAATTRSWQLAALGPTMHSIQRPAPAAFRGKHRPHNHRPRLVQRRRNPPNTEKPPSAASQKSSGDRQSRPRHVRIAEDWVDPGRGGRHTGRAGIQSAGMPNAQRRYVVVVSQEKLMTPAVLVTTPPRRGPLAVFRGGCTPRAVAAERRGR